MSSLKILLNQLKKLKLVFFTRRDNRDEMGAFFRDDKNGKSAFFRDGKNDRKEMNVFFYNQY